MRNKGERLARYRRETGQVRGISLTQRDREIIRQVAEFRFLRSSQILRLVNGGRAQILRRLQMLYHHGWLDRPRCQIDYFHRGGSQPMVYGLGSRGAGLMRRELDMSFSRMTWSGSRSPVGRLFLEHTLMVAELLISVAERCREAGEGVEFIREPDLLGQRPRSHAVKWKAKLERRTVGLVPDAVFGLRVNSGGTSSLLVCFLEADRGTMPVQRRSLHLSSIAKKFAAYAALWKTRKFADDFQTRRFAVLTFTTSAERAENIRKAATQIPEGRGLFHCWTEAEASCGTAFNALLARARGDRGHDANDMIG